MNEIGWLCEIKKIRDGEFERFVAHVRSHLFDKSLEASYLAMAYCLRDERVRSAAAAATAHFEHAVLPNVLKSFATGEKSGGAA